LILQVVAGAQPKTYSNTQFSVMADETEALYRTSAGVRTPEKEV
jgi:hypothetical protein